MSDPPSALPSLFPLSVAPSSVATPTVTLPSVMLRYRQHHLRSFSLSRPLLVGSGSSADIVIHDENLAPRHGWLSLSGGQVCFRELPDPDDQTTSEGVRLRPDIPVQLGAEHSIVLLLPNSQLKPSTSTADVPSKACRIPSYAVVWTRKGESGRHVVSRSPVLVGTRADNDVRLPDPTVSGRHCRMGLCREGLVVRDLGSRNGTWVDGLRVREAVCRPGARIRVGETEFTVGRTQAQPKVPGALIAVSRLMVDLMTEVERCARVEFPVLVLGESGSGKEGIARELHQKSARAKGPFVAVNGGGLTGALLESELFGHERGSFTGAMGAHKGFFEQADGGTLFLDEVAELPSSTQAKLLRVLDGQEIRRIGTESPVQVSVRVIAATHRNLARAVAEGKFRGDLYYRLSQTIVQVPPLRDRPADIGPLATHFLHRYQRDLGPRDLTRGALKRLKAHPFPGNVRELRNIVSTAALLSGARDLSADAIDAAIDRVSPTTNERQDLERALARHEGNVAAAARHVGIARSTFRDRLRGVRSVRPVMPVEEKKGA